MAEKHTIEKLMLQMKIRAVEIRYDYLPSYLKAYVDKKCPDVPDKDEAWIERRLAAIHFAFVFAKWSLLIVSSIVAGSIAYFIASCCSG